MEEPAAQDQLLGRGLDVVDAGAGGHPLRVAAGDQAAAAVRVLVLERAVEQVGGRLEAAVGVPGRALGLAGPVVHRAHLVHHDERVEEGEVDAGKGAAHGEALALEAAGGGGDGPNRAGTAPGGRLGEAGKDGGVGGDGGHGGLLRRDCV